MMRNRRMSAQNQPIECSRNRTRIKCHQVCLAFLRIALFALRDVNKKKSFCFRCDSILHDELQHFRVNV